LSFEALAPRRFRWVSIALATLLIVTLAGEATSNASSPFAAMTAVVQEAGGRRREERRKE